MSACRTFADTSTPLGAFRVVCEGGAVVEAGFLTRDISDHARSAWASALRCGESDAEGLATILAQIASYFRGERTDFDVRLRPAGTPFQTRVWDALLRIPYGETRGYGEVATALGDPGASRAVGAANGRNPISVLVPCHRVVAASGALTGYAGGIERKRSLLALERRVRYGSLGL